MTRTLDLSRSWRQFLPAAPTPLPGELLQLRLPATDLAPLAAALVTTHGAQLLSLLASGQRPENGHFWLHAPLHFPSWRQTLVLEAALDDDLHYPALSPLLASANWYEREIHDLYGIVPVGLQLDPLVLHRDWPRTLHPLRRDFDPATRVPPAEVPHVFDFHEPVGSHHVAVGPIHAGIIEPGHLRFCVTGEQIHGFSAQLFYTHKGLEKMAEGQDLTAGLALAENTCGQCAFSHSVAYSQALESLAGLVLPPRALALRTLGLELERLANHAADLAAMASAGGFGFASVHMAEIREQQMRLNRQLSGHRFFRGWNGPGGLKRDVEPGLLADLGRKLQTLEARVLDWQRLVSESSGFLDRVEATGSLSREQVLALGLVGVAARASGIGRDVRLDRPYAAYAHYPPAIALRNYGDARARLDVRLAEMQISFRLLAGLLAELPTGPVALPLPPDLPSGVPALGVVESSRGELVHWLMLDQQRIARWHVRAPGYLNWRGVAAATGGSNIVPDGPLINKSFNLCYACVDR